MSQECTTDDCRNFTSEYLCSQCVSDLQSWIARIPILLVELRVTIARQDHVRPAGGGGGGSKPGSAAPINFDAWQISENLKTVGKSAKEYAHAEDAAGMAWLIQDWVKKAELLILGPEPEPVNTSHARERLKAEVPKEPMPTRDLKKWLQITHGIQITGEQLRQWVHRKKLQRANEEGRPTYYPAVVLAIAKHQDTQKVNN